MKRIKQINRISTAAFLAGVTTLSVTLPPMPASAGVARDTGSISQSVRTEAEKT